MTTEERNKMVAENMGLVYSFVISLNVSPEYREDFIQEGAIGLMRAVERFDEERGVKLSTYAIWWIQQGVFKAIRNSRLIHIPENVLASASKTLNEWKEEGYPCGLKDYCRSRGRSYQDILYSKIITVPLEDVWQQNDDATPPKELAFIKDDYIIEKVNDDFIKEKVMEGLSRIPPREAECIIGYYGLGQDEPKTCDALGKMYGVTRERIRQVIMKGLRRLSRNKELNGLLED